MENINLRSAKETLMRKLSSHAVYMEIHPTAVTAGNMKACISFHTVNVLWGLWVSGVIL